MGDCLVIGGASSLWDDLRAIGPFRGTVIGVNDALYTFEHLTALATLHPERVDHWRKKRRAKGWPDVPVYCLDRQYADVDGFRIWRTDDPDMDPVWSGGSSGLYAVGVALHAYGAERVVCVGCPMDASPNVYRDEAAWEKHRVHRRAWEKAVERGWLENVRSPSGWTRELLGWTEPKQEAA